VASVAVATQSSVGKPIAAHREALNAFVAKHEVAWDLTMASLALIYIVAGLFEDHPHGALNLDNLIPLELAITAIFAVEFSGRFYAAASRGAYLRRHWIDLLALLPAIRYLRFLRLGRLIYLLQAARVLRLGMLIRLLAEFDRVGNRVRWIANKNGVHIILLASLGFVIIGGSLVWEIEHTSNRAFANFGDAVWWAFSTMTTIGYGPGPSTVPGRLIAGVIMVIGIGCFGLITATVAAYFIEHSREHQASPNELMAALEDIRGRLAGLEKSQVADAPRRVAGVVGTGDGRWTGEEE
jgi:voltage-gated potassium channel